MSGLLYLGALRYLQQEGYNNYIRHISGASIGALFAAAFTIDMSMGELEVRFKNFIKDKTHSNIPLSFDTILQSFNDLGIDDGHRLVDIIKDKFEYMTFLELSKKTGKNLIISATHVDTMQPTYFSLDTTPNVLVIEAIRASIAVPFLIKPVEIGNDFYVDGGVTDGVPIYVFNNTPPETILILHLSKVTNSKIILNSDEQKVKPSILTYISSMFQTYLRNYLSINLLEMKYPNYCRFTNCPISFAPLIWNDNELILKITEEEIDQSFAVGYTHMQKFIEKKNKLFNSQAQVLN